MKRSMKKLKNTAKIVEGNHLINNCSWKPLGGMSKWKLVGKNHNKEYFMMNGWQWKRTSKEVKKNDEDVFIVKHSKKNLGF